MSNPDGKYESVSDYSRARLDSDLLCLPLGDDTVIFSERTQSLLSLNATAALVVEKLRDGTPVASMAGELIAGGFAQDDEATNWVASTLQALDEHGFLLGRLIAKKPATSASTSDENGDGACADMPALAAFVPQRVGYYRLLETCAEIRFAWPQQMRLVDSVIGHLKVETGVKPSIIIDIPGTRYDRNQLRSLIYKDGRPADQAGRLSGLGPKVKNILWLSAVNAHDFLFYIHAGVVRSGERCILLPAAAGSGKSSLTSALTKRGLGYYSDEVALIDRATYRVPPVPLAICVKSTGWDVLERYFPSLPTLPTHRRSDGKIVRYVPPPANAHAQPPVPVGHIIFPRHSKDAATKLTPISCSAALAKLMDQCLALRQRFDNGNIAELVRWIGEIKCYSLDFSSLEEAVELIVRETSDK